MTDRHEKPDQYSGIPWVYVTPKEVRAHPKGQLTPVLWAIGLFFIASALLKMGLVRASGMPLGWTLVLGAWPFLTGLGLLMRAPWALILAVISAGLSAYTLLAGASGIGGIAGGGAVYVEGDSYMLVPLFELLAYIGILFHLMDGDRPNFIYRHRYRKYSVLKEGGE